MRHLLSKYKKLVREFLKTLKLPKKKSPHPIAIRPFGPCWTGKTTAMKYLAKRLPLVHIKKEKKFVPVEKGEGMAPDRKTAVNCYLYSVKHYNYDDLMPRAITVINTSKPIAPQIKNTISFLKKETGP
ncbi:MAG TPA: hypothetical protein ENH26_02330 [Candidatus Wolfebacteria bacterium]|nr:hypothetical protein [Candidatus Wolfebacteria bacterium]